jgi:hypothetical protein
MLAHLPYANLFLFGSWTIAFRLANFYVFALCKTLEAGGDSCSLERDRCIDLEDICLLGGRKIEGTTSSLRQSRVCPIAWLPPY